MESIKEILYVSFLIQFWFVFWNKNNNYWEKSVEKFHLENLRPFVQLWKHYLMDRF